MLANLDMNSNRILNLPAATSNTEPVNYAQFRAAQGDLLYEGTIDSSVVTFTPTGAGAEDRTVYEELVLAPHTPQQYGAVADGVTDDSAAFAAAWAAIKSTGGEIFIPPGNYYLNDTWELDVDQAAPYQYSISGYGARITSGPGVTGFAIRVYKGYNNFGARIAGLHINHRGNSTVAGGVQAYGAANLKLKDIAVECHGNSATYAAFQLEPYNPGDGDTNSFWTLIDGCTTRKRGGADGGMGVYSYAGVVLKGNANATKITKCSFGSVTHAIRFDTDGTLAAMANAVLIVDNDFEGVTNAITINTALPATYAPSGLRIQNNRVESCTTFVNWTGAAVLDAGYPPIIRDNYLTVGSVTNHNVNPNSQFMIIDEPSYFGIAPSSNKVGGPSDYQIITEGAGKNLKIGNFAGSSSFNLGHLVMGSYHIWVDAAGNIRINSSAPASATDGQPLGPLLASPRAGLSYSASMTPDASTSNTFVITATNNTAFTINAPTNPTTGQILIMLIKNTSGGALGTATWNAAYKMAAWAQPATGFSRSITFQYDGASWIELTRTSADIPN